MDNKTLWYENIEFEQYLSIENLSNKSASDAFIAITDFICPDGGPQDEGIARSAYISAIEESPEIASIRFEDLTSEQILVIVERTMANSIFNRITNDIGNKIILLPKDRNMSDSLIGQMKDFVKGSVSDAVSNLKIKAGNIRQEDSLKIVDRVYKTAFDIMINKVVQGWINYYTQNAEEARLLEANYSISSKKQMHPVYYSVVFSFYIHAGSAI